MANSRVSSLASVVMLMAAPVVLALVVSCGGLNTTTTQNPFAGRTGTVTTSITDPPTCTLDFKNVYVTITRVRAHISSEASLDEGGWVDLVDLRSNPKQVDLLSLASPACVLTQLGSTSGLQPGKYQQIRLHLLSNSPGSEAKPSDNKCGGPNGPFNCVVTQDNTTPQALLLSSEAQTGIKIPPGQIAGGGINLTAGQSADVSIDFDACASVLRQGDGEFRLKPTLRAGAVSVTNNSISGKVVDSTNNNAIPGAIVLIEQPDAADSSFDRVISSKLSASDGTFTFCPLPSGNYDVVVAATTTSASLLTTTYNATIAFKVPLGTNLNNIPLVPEAGTSTQPATITGQVTSAGAGGAIPANVTLSALQQATPTGGPAINVTIPVFGAMAQPPNVTTAAGSSCPAGTACATYTLLVPASNPQVGTFSSGAITYAAPATGTVSYSLNGVATTCSPSSQTISSLTVTAGGTTSVATPMAFTGCQ